MATFDSIFPTLLTKCAALHDLLLVVAYMLFVVGIITSVTHGFSPKSLASFGVRLVVLTALLSFLPQWGNELQNLMQNSILSGLNVDPSNVQDQYNQLLVIKRDTGTGKSWWDILSDATGSAVEVLISALLWIIGEIASFLLYWAYVFQKVVLHLGYGLSPLLIGFMAIRGLRGIGTNYLLHLVGVLLWPLGWAVAAMVTQAILDFMTDPSFKFIDPTAVFYGLQNTLGVALLGFWIIFSTIAAPMIIQRVIAHGMLIGNELIHGAFGSLGQTAATTAGASAVAAPIGSSLATASSAGMAAILSSTSTAAGLGSAGAILIAGSGLPPRSARGRPGDDITSDRAVRDLIAKSRNQFPGSYAGY
ncbi:MAG: hypothetical protein KGS61_17455 [Verrucomicrobia bacterium]|nr:hypothetical protein [Verrucomicrobiota bacterium]